MPTPLKLTDSMLDNVLILSEKGLSSSKTAEIVGMTKSIVCTILRTYRKIQNGETLTPSEANKPHVVRWACNRLGKDYSPAPAPSPAQEAPQETRDAADEANTALAVAAILEAIKSLTASVSSLENRLSTMQMTLAGTRDDANQNTKKIVEAINVNGDIQTKEWQDVKDRLEAIKINTKALRKGGSY